MMPFRKRTGNTEEQFCLKWKHHYSNIKLMFTLLLERESLCDVTLVCDDGTLKAHKMILSACSTYFDSAFSNHAVNNILSAILKDFKFHYIKSLVGFMYKGEINIERSQLNMLLKTAEDLQIKGLAGNSSKLMERLIGSSESHNSVEDCGEQKSSRKRKRKQDFKGTRKIDDSFALNSAADAEGFHSESDKDSQSSLWCHESVYAEHDGAEHDGAEHDDAEHDDAEHGDVEAELSTNDTGDKCVSMDINEGLENTESIEHRELPSARFNLTSECQTSVKSSIPSELLNVIKMTYFVQQGGRRNTFWEEPSTKKVLDAVKNKVIEMKIASELLGVSYGTLYGRYRDVYGVLKEPYRLQEFWDKPTVCEAISEAQRNEPSSFEAADMLNEPISPSEKHLGDEENIDNDACQLQAPGDDSDIRIVGKRKDNNSSI